MKTELLKTKETTVYPEFIDEGFGFPVHLLNVPMVKVHGIWTPDINYSKLSSLLLRALIIKPGPLTGNELKFIRTKFEMTLAAFGHLFDVTHQAIMKWEKAKDMPTKMSWSTEKDIRLFVYSKLCGNKGFYKIYKGLLHKPVGPAKETRVDMQKRELVLT